MFFEMMIHYQLLDTDPVKVNCSVSGHSMPINSGPNPKNSDRRQSSAPNQDFVSSSSPQALVISLPPRVLDVAREFDPWRTNHRKNFSGVKWEALVCGE